MKIFDHLNQAMLAERLAITEPKPSQGEIDKISEYIVLIA